MVSHSKQKTGMKVESARDFLQRQHSRSGMCFPQNACSQNLRDLIGEQGHCSWSELRRSHAGVEWAPNPVWLASRTESQTHREGGHAMSEAGAGVMQMPDTKLQGRPATARAGREERVGRLVSMLA